MKKSTKIVKKMVDGGSAKQLPPIYTNDPKDPRLQAYNDSLYMHNEGAKALGERIRAGKQVDDVSKYHDEQSSYVSNDFYYLRDAPNGGTGIHPAVPHSDHPSGFGEHPYKAYFIHEPNDGISYVPLFEPPKQPIIYQQGQDHRMPASSSTPDYLKWLHRGDIQQQKPLPKDNIQQLPISQPNQLPINTPQPSQIQPMYPDKANYSNGVMDDYHKSTGLYKYGGSMKQTNTKIKKFKKADTGTNIPGEQQIHGINPNSQQTMLDVQQGFNTMKSDTNLVNDPIAQQQMKPNKGLASVSPDSIGSYNTPQDQGTNGGQDTQFKLKTGKLNPKGGVNTNDLFMGSLALISGALPYTPVNSNQNKLQEAYNPYPNGTGSQAIADSGIHIKSSHKGRFTAYKERTGKTTEQALHSKDPHVRQMANFAKNAKKWKHEDGGKIEYMMGGPVGMSGQMATMTSNMGSPSPHKKKAANGDYVPLSTQEKDNWNAFHNNLATNNPNYGSDILNHNTPSSSSIQAWNQSYPQQAITRPVADYQNEFTTTPLGRSAIDNYGTATNQEVGRKTGASSFMQYATEHYNSKGQLIPQDSKNFGTNQGAATAMVNSWSQPKSAQWQSNDQNIPMDAPQSVLNQNFPVAKGQKNNFHTDENADYSVDSIRNQEAYYGGKIIAANGVQVEDNSWQTGMMKAKMATSDALGNPDAHRMIQNYPQQYTFTGNEQIPGDFDHPPAGSIGSHFMGSYGNYAIPSIQKSGDTLKFNPNPRPTDKGAIMFNNDNDADYFAEHYKEVAPMMRNWEKKEYGGTVDYNEGSEHDLSMEEIKRLEKLGYKLKY